MNELENLKSEIINLSGELGKIQEKVKGLMSKFFKKKAENFISSGLSDKRDVYWSTIKSFTFSQNTDSVNISWKCKYIHETDKYIINNYCINEESEDEELMPCFKRTKVYFGYTNGKYFIQKNLSSELNDVVSVYTHKQLPKLYSLEYENACEVDNDEVMELYGKNMDIPEWLLIRFLSQINIYRYYPDKLKKYFSIV